MLEKKYIPELNRKLITLKKDMYAYVFAPDMYSGSTVGCVAGETYMLNGNVYYNEGSPVWFELGTGDTGSSIICFSASQVENLEMEDGGSLGSFLGKLDLKLPISPGFSDKVNSLLKKLLLFGAGALLLSNILNNKDNE